MVGRYILDSSIFDIIENTTPGSGNEIQLTDAIATQLQRQTVYGYEFSGQLKIIVPDLPCAARSSNDPNLSISSLATDMLALLDSLDVENVHLVGHSMGTIVCQHMVAMAPERVTDLVLLGPVGQAPEPARESIKARAALAREKGMEPIADATATTALSTDTKQSNANAQGFVREMIIRQDPEGYALSCIALSESMQANLDLITCPCLLITGD